MESNPFDPQVQIRRRSVLTPCSSKEGLAAWCIDYLNLDFPDTLIDEQSTGSVLDTIWEVYSAGVNRKTFVMDDGEESRRLLMYASRAGYKTLAASVLELLAMLHMLRNVIHMAAIEQQSAKAQEYLRNFLALDGIEEFNVGNNKRTVAVLWFEHKKTGDILTNAEWKILNSSVKKEYYRHVRYAKIIVNTNTSANSDHTSFVCFDEIDVMRYIKAYNEAKLIPDDQKDVYGRNQPPISILLSTRKSSGGLVQREIDEAVKTGTVIRHWNILDVTARCPDERHKPELPKVKVWVHFDSFRSWDAEKYENLKTSDPKLADKCVEKEVYAGCEKCRIVVGCLGRLAKQTSNAALLKGVSGTIGTVRENSAEMVISQLMCWKPGNEGAIYPRLSMETHALSAAEMWEKVTGEPAPVSCNRDMLISLFISREATSVAGMDFGFTHNFAVAWGFIYGRVLYILDCIEIPELELSQCVEICDQRIKKYDPKIWPDVAYPGHIKTFRKSGYRMGQTKKDVIGGIEAVRRKIMPAGGSEPELFVLRGDDGGNLFIKRMVAYKWKLDSAGMPTDVPDEEEDDLCDAGRYLVFNSFEKTSIIAPTGAKPPEPNQPGPPTAQAWMQSEIAKAMGLDVPTPGVSLSQVEQKKGRKGSILFDLT